jgi:hypothetical protein
VRASATAHTSDAIAAAFGMRGRVKRKGNRVAPTLLGPSE